jgi:hypothetical protein
MVEDATSPTAPRETLMTRSLKQTMISGLAALTLGAGLLAASAPAQARPWNHGGAVTAGVIGGLAIGAMAASAAHPVYAAPVYAVPVYDRPACYRTRQPVTDIYGNLYYRRVKVCH